MELVPRLRLMNWLVSQGLTGLPENDLIRGFCERCRAEGLNVSRGMVFIDTLHPIFEGRGFRWNDVESNQPQTFEFGPTEEGDAAEGWRRSIFYDMLEQGHEHRVVDLTDIDSQRYSRFDELAASDAAMTEALAQRVQGFANGGLVGSSLVNTMQRPALDSASGPVRTVRVELAANGRQVSAQIDERDEGRLLQLLQSAHVVDGIVKGLKQPDWPSDPWQALHRLAQMVVRVAS